jgi:hypothetical protein
VYTGFFKQANYEGASKICSERGMALASFEQPAESNAVLDFLSGSCRLLYINTFQTILWISKQSPFRHADNDVGQKSGRWLPVAGRDGRLPVKLGTWPTCKIRWKLRFDFGEFVLCYAVRAARELYVRIARTTRVWNGSMIWNFTPSYKANFRLPDNYQLLPIDDGRFCTILRKKILTLYFPAPRLTIGEQKYIIPSETATAEEAKAICDKRNMDLVSFETPKESDSVFDFVGALGGCTITTHFPQTKYLF